MLFAENVQRSVLKSITFRIFVMATDGIIIYLITGSLLVSFWVIIFSNISSTIIFYFHERVWNRIEWGKIKEK